MRNILACPTIACLAIGCLALTACATSPDAASQFDGTYTGSGMLIRGTTGWCGPDNVPAAITISGGRFAYPFPITGVITPVVVQAQLRADGTFSGGTQYLEPEPGPFRGPLASVTLAGHIADGTLDAKIDSVNCGRHLSLRPG
jgi:hypothetical protein